jgi:hypothetical protein
LNYVVETLGYAVAGVVKEGAQCQGREMDAKEEQRVAITFCCKADISASKTVEMIQKAYVDAAGSRTTIFLSCTNGFKRVRRQ